MDERHAKMMEQANEQWAAKAVSSSEELVAKQTEAFDTMRDSFVGFTNELTHGDKDKGAVLKLVNRANMHTHSILTRAEELLAASKETFETILRPEGAMEDERISQEAMYAFDDQITLPPMELRTASQITLDQVFALGGQLTEVFNPLRDPDYKYAAEAIATQVAGKFAAQVAIGKITLEQITDKDERAVAEQRLFMQAFEGMVKQLPVAFISGHLDYGLEAKAEEAGFAVRAKPDHAINESIAQGTVQDAGKKRGLE